MIRIPFLNRPPRVAVIRLSGAIGTGGQFGQGLNDAALSPLIERAFARKGLAAVALAINSPGGSPAQSSLIAARIRRLADDRKIPVHAFIEDVAASGGYWLACAADHIWVDATSITGSIGVISAGFGFPELIARYGVERRVHTAGESKSFMDPFRPERAEDVGKLNALLEQLHTVFKKYVLARRGLKLAADRDLFTGDIWVGTDAVAVGLADGLAHLEPKMKELYGDKTRFLRLDLRKPWYRRFGASMGAGVVSETLASVEERALWARYGL